MMKRLHMTFAVCMILVLWTGQVAGTPQDGEVLLKLNKGIDVFGRVLKEVSVHYVDAVDPESFVQAGIDGMLRTLDPYTVYIGSGDDADVDLLTTGRYGGIGITIGLRDGAIQVISVMEGYSAQRQGMIPGDRILAVDGVSLLSKRPEDVKGLTRGEPGTEVTVLVEREGEDQPLEFVLLREEIHLKNVTYADYVGSGIGYIRLERFSRQAGEEVRQAIKQLKLQGDLRGLVLDLRGNPGGLLDAAVDVTSKFVPRGSLIVTTKGRTAGSARPYLSPEEPLLPETPMIVLTDRNSASASEIVSGALQDLDRALILGVRTFGKGLVQTVRDLNYGAKLKLTTARYYTPSGRCIQEFEYKRRDTRNVFGETPDTVRQEFRTARGRIVLEHGGITPDSVVEEQDPGPMVKEMHRKSLFFRFAHAYASAHPEAQTTGVTEEILREFRTFLSTHKFDYREDTEAKLAELREVAEKTRASRSVLADLDALAEKLEKEKGQSFERYRSTLSRELAIALMGRLRGEEGRIRASLNGDRQVETAVELLRTPAVYAKKLGL